MLPILFDRVRFSSLIWRRRGPVAAHFVRIILSYIVWLVSVARRRGNDRSSMHLRYGKYLTAVCRYLMCFVFHALKLSRGNVIARGVLSRGA